MDKETHKIVVPPEIEFQHWYDEIMKMYREVLEQFPVVSNYSPVKLFYPGGHSNEIIDFLASTLEGMGFKVAITISNNLGQTKHIKAINGIEVSCHHFAGDSFIVIKKRQEEVPPPHFIFPLNRSLNLSAIKETIEAIL